jgi:hypothetical protein
MLSIWLLLAAGVVGVLATVAQAVAVLVDCSQI